MSGTSHIRSKAADHNAAMLGLDGLSAHNYKAQKNLLKRTVTHLFKTVPVMEPEFYITTKAILGSPGADYEELYTLGYSTMNCDRLS